MTAVEPIKETPSSPAVPRLMVELPSRPRVFLGNLRDLVFPRRLPPLKILSAPAPYWPDVFVKRELPWQGLIKSIGGHIVFFGLLVALTRLFALQPRVVARPVFNHSDVISYEPAEYLPPLDTRIARETRLRMADPEFSRQPIISVPPEADNRSQTIVAPSNIKPPEIKLKQNLALPNIVAWSNEIEKPRLAIPPVPLTPAAEITRIAPPIENSVVSPPPEAAQLVHHRDSSTLEPAVLAPPPDLQVSNADVAFNAPQPAVIAPPPSVEVASSRPLGGLNIGHSSVIAPAPQLSVAEQRTIPRSLSSLASAPEIVAPPPSLSSGSSGESLSGQSFGSRGHIIALNLHPAVSAPPEVPSGNRRGTFAATPEGHPGASGSPGSASISGNKETGNGSDHKAGNLPSGLYVGSVAPKSSPVSGDTSGKASNSVNPKLLANALPPHMSGTASRPMQPENASKLSEAEQAVFGNRRFYSLTLNMPNLNSAGGSWIIRFAEINGNSNDHRTNGHDVGHEEANQQEGNQHGASNSGAGDLSQPTATRKVDPAYPMELMRENVAGTVILYAIIRADGTVGNVRVLRGVDDRIDRYACQAVAQWQFQPATKNGAPVDVEATFQIPFRPLRVESNF